MTKGLLISQHKETSGRVFVFSDGAVIGRGADCAIPIPHGSVSRRHALIERRGAEYIVIDCDSRNGTRVNGVAVARRVLHDGDLLAIGDVGLVFHEVDEDEVGRPVLPPPVDEVADVCPTVSDDASRVVVTGSLEMPAVRALNAWQIVRAVVSCGPGGEEVLLKRIAEDLSGIRGIHRVVFYASPGVIDRRARWTKGGKASPQPGICLPDELIVSVADKGVPVPEALCHPAGGNSGKMPAVGAVCVPVKVAGASRCSLYVESTGQLARDALHAVLAVAEALGIGLTARVPADWRRGSPNTRPAVEIIGRSEALRRCIAIAQRAAQADSTVLIRGESGTGKELFARLIFGESQRKGNAFITVHSSAIEETLLGSSLFGHEKGAFTGAVGMKRGLFEDADDGTLFLDEVGEIGSATQIKLLRVLQEGEFMRLGGNRPIRVDVRIIAATNKDLEKAIRGGSFREDLYYRLNVIELTLPPLRDRKEDIPDLVGHFVALLRKGLATHVKDVSDEAMAAITRYDWPGNVRELRNVVERALVLADGSTLVPDDLPAEMALAGAPDLREGAAAGSALDKAEFQHIRRVLEQCGGNKKEAAKQLGISRSTLYEKLRGI